jgi:hypothetical protein
MCVSEALCLFIDFAAACSDPVPLIGTEAHRWRREVGAMCHPPITQCCQLTFVVSYVTPVVGCVQTELLSCPLLLHRWLSVFTSQEGDREEARRLCDFGWRILFLFGCLMKF